MNEQESLQYALEHGMINMSYIQDQIEMQKRKELLEKHPYAIWEGKDGKWRSYLPNKEKGRKLVKKSSRKSVEDAVIAYWRDKVENPTVRDVYNEWINGKLDRQEIQRSTKERYDRQFDESLSEFGKIKIKNIEECDIEDIVLSSIYEHQLTRRGYSNLRTLLYGIFKRAKKKKLVNFSITEVIADMEISRKSFRRIVKTDEELVFSEKETETIINYIMDSDLDIINLGILLYFKSGLRPGELSALKTVDISSRIINVCRTEISYKNDSGKIIYEVRDFPKTEAGIRQVILPASSEWILKKIRTHNLFGEYLFERNGKRIRTYTFTRRLKMLCRKTKIAEKSLNKIRKTYGSMLIDSGVDESLIISQMGHTDIKTTKTYYYKNRKSLDQKLDMIDNVLGL